MSEERTVSVRVRAIVGEYQAAMAKARMSTSDFWRDSQKMAVEHRQAMTDVGMVTAATGAGLVAALTGAAAAAISFESSFAGVRKTVDGTEVELAAISGELRGMAREIPTAVNELNGIAEAAGQLGIEKSAIVGFTRTIADLGETTNLTGQEGATSLARLANITQMAQGDFDRLGSTVVALGNNLATTEREIVEMGLRLAGAGSQVGMTEAEILALAGSLSSVGVEAEAGGSAFSRVMVEINKAVMSGGDNLAVFAEVAGQSAGQFAAAWQDNAATGLTAFVQGLARVQAEGGNVDAVLESLELEGIRVADALKRSAGAGDLMAGAINLASDAWEENTALTDEAAQRYETVESKIQVAKNSFVDLGISLGNVVLPALGELAQFTANVIGFFADLPGPAQTVVAVIGGVSGAVLLLSGGLLLLLPRIAATKVALAELAATAGLGGSLARGMQGTASLMTGPWGVALAAATVGIGLFATAKQNAKVKVDNFVSTLDGETAALTGNTRSHVANRLEQEGALEAAQALGLSLSTVTDAALGNRDAVDAVRSATEAYVIDGEKNLSRSVARAHGHERETEAALTLRGAIAGVTDTMRESIEVKQREIAATRDSADTTGVAADAMRLNAQAAAYLGVELAALEPTALATSLAVDELTESQTALQKAMESFEGPWETYQRILKDKETAEREAAQATADATESSKDSWEDYVDAVEVSLTEYAAALEEQLEAQRNWEDNLVTVAGRAGREVAMILASMGEEGVELVAKMATGTDEELQRLVPLLIESSGRAADALPAALEGRMGDAEAAAAALAKRVEDQMLALKFKMFEAGIDGALGLADGLIDGAGNVYDSTFGLARRAIEGAKDGLDSHSPSRVFYGLGEDTIQGYVNALDDRGMDVEAATRSLMGDAVDAADDVLSAWRAGQASEAAGEGLDAAIGQVGSLEDRQAALPDLIAQARMRLGTASRRAEAITPEEQARIYAAQDQLRRAEEARDAAEPGDDQARLRNDALVALNRLIEARKAATAPTREVADAERELNALLEEHARIDQLLAEAAEDVEEAQIKVLDAELRLLSTTTDLDVANAQLASETLTAVATQAGVTTTTIDSLTAAYARLIAQTRELEKAASAPIAGASDASVTNAFKSVGVDPGSVIDEADWRAAARKVQHDPGVRLDPADKQMILDLISKQGNTYQLTAVTSQADVAEQFRRMELTGGLAP